MGLLLKYYYDILLFNTKYLYDVFRNRLRQSILFSLRFTTISGDRYYWHRITRLILDVSLVLHFCVYYAYKIVFKKEEDWSLFRFLRARSTQRNGKVVILNYLVIPIHKDYLVFFPLWMSYCYTNKPMKIPFSCLRSVTMIFCAQQKYSLACWSEPLYSEVILIGVIQSQFIPNFEWCLSTAYLSGHLPNNTSYRSQVIKGI